MQPLALLVVPIDVVLKFIESLSAVLVIFIVVIIIRITSTAIVILTWPSPVLHIVHVSIGVNVHIIDVQVVFEDLIQIREIRV